MTQCLFLAAAFSACTDRDTTMDTGIPPEQQQEEEMMQEQYGEDHQQEDVIDCTGLTEEQCAELHRQHQQALEDAHQTGDDMRDSARDLEDSAEDIGN